MKWRRLIWQHILPLAFTKLLVCQVQDIQTSELKKLREKNRRREPKKDKTRDSKKEENYDETTPKKL